MQLPSKDSVKDAAKSPWLGVLLALIGLVHARVDLEKQKQINAETLLKERLLAKTSDKISSTAEDNGKILQEENQRLRVMVAALAAYTAANGRKLDNALGETSADDVVALPASVTVPDVAPVTAPPVTVPPAVTQPTTAPSATPSPAMAPQKPAPVVEVPLKTAQQAVESLAKSAAPQVKLRKMPRLMPKVDRDADGLPDVPSEQEQTDRPIKF